MATGSRTKGAQEYQDQQEVAGPVAKGGCQYQRRQGFLEPVAKGARTKGAKGKMSKKYLGEFDGEKCKNRSLFISFVSFPSRQIGFHLDFHMQNHVNKDAIPI